MSKVIYITDRSASELDDKCGMAFYANRLEGGQGIVSTDESLFLKIGRESHEDLATLSEMEDISEEAITEAVRDITGQLTVDDIKITSAMEVLYRRLGWFVAQALFIEPRTRELFENVHTEHEIILDRTPLWVPITPDRVLRAKANGKLVYREYKSVKFLGAPWQQHWRYDIQLHAGIKALNEELKEELSYAQIMGLSKGHTIDGRLHHPYVWAYRNSATGEWTEKYQRSSEWSPAPVWEYPGGIVQWVKKCGKELAISQFPQSAPVTLDERMLDRWIARRTARMEEVAAVREAAKKDLDLRALHFEERTRNCRPAFGDPCPYLAYCWNAEINADPIGSGKYIPRVPHHDVEIMANAGHIS